MAINNYVVIDTVQNKCTNIILWDGVNEYNPGNNLILQLSDGSINVNDIVIKQDGVYITTASAPILPPSLTAVDLFNVDQFVQDLLGAFEGDVNILPYYGVVKDLASFGNFPAMRQMIMGLLSSNKITSDEVNTFIAVLANQNIDLTKF